MKWIYPIVILTIVFVVVIIGFGGNRPAPVPESMYILQFENDFKSTISKNSQFGSVNIKQFNIEFKCDNICINQNGDVISTYRGEEVSKFTMDQILIDSDFCVGPKDDKVTFRFEGTGNATRVSIIYDK